MSIKLCQVISEWSIPAMNWQDAASEYYKQTWYGAGFMALPKDWQRALKLVNDEIYNGGYLQFFVNHGHEVYHLASRSLQTIGANRMVKIIHECQTIIDQHFLAAKQHSADRTALLPNEIISPNGKQIKKPGSILPNSALDRIHGLPRRCRAIGTRLLRAIDRSRPSSKCVSLPPRVEIQVASTEW
jgi:hypothetical protein